MATAYRRPGVTVVQEFIGLVPALATFALPSVSIGAAYQLLEDDLLGTYSANLQVYAYAGLLAGAQVDLEKLASDELFPATKKPVVVKLSGARLEIVAEVGTGQAAGNVLTDVTASIFSSVRPGDLVKIAEVSGEIIAPQVDGVTTDTIGSRDILTAGTLGQFSGIEINDVITVIGGTNTNVGAFNVIEILDDDNVKVDAEINDGVGASTDVAYSIAGVRGDENAGEHRVKTVTDANTLVLEGELTDGDESPVTYSIQREVSEIELDRVDSLPNNGFLAEDTGISLPAALTYTDALLETNNIVSAEKVLADYRGLRNDLAANVREFSSLSDLQAFFGVDQIDPANPLAFGLSIMLQNTVTAVNGLGLDGNAVSDETLSYQAALDVLKLTEMYALVPLTQNAVIHQLFKTHVEQLSQPDNKRERVAIINRLKISMEVIADEKAIVDTVSGARIIVNTQTDGEHNGTALDTLTDATTDAFLTVEQGDIVTIVSGTNVTAGEYVVGAKTDNNTLVMESDFVTGGAATDVNYFITRPDGVAADGIGFYDRDAQFISDGVAPGYYLEISAAANSFAVGRFKIVGVLSEREVQVEQIPGITSAVGGITYEINRDLSRTEEAAAIGGYSESFGSRRVVNLWPDILETPVGQVVSDLPGYFGACAIGALTTGLPTQQGFTNLSISGFLGLQNSSGYFDDDQLDTIAGGGTMVLLQDGEEQPLYVLHQLTTDRSAIKFQEYSVTKNVDFIAKFLRGVYIDMIGQWNIIDTTMDELRTRATASMTFLKDDTRLPRIGGVIRSGVLQSLEESETQIDTVKMRFKIDIPIPLNQLDITIEV